MTHVFVKHESCTKDSCMICDGGLGLCTVCGCLEGQLATECPGFDVGQEVGDLIYRGVVDFKDGGWTFNYKKMHKEEEETNNEEYYTRHNRSTL